MNKLVRGLLSGASLATLQLAAVSAARAAGTTISGANLNGFTVTSAQQFDFIEVDNATVITGDLTNEGTVGISSTAIDVSGAGTIITGDILNAANGNITATATGIHVRSGAVVGGIDNGGNILVSNTTGGSVHGVIIDQAGGIGVTNAGTLTVAGSKIVAAGVTTNFTIHAHGMSGSLAGATAGIVNFDNEASLLVSANAAATSAEGKIKAVASGFDQSAHGIAGAVTEIATNEGTLSLAAKAVGTGFNTTKHLTASAIAEEAMFQRASGTGNPASVGSLSMHNSGTITIDATALASGAGDL